MGKGVRNSLVEHGNFTRGTVRSKKESLPLIGADAFIIAIELSVAIASKAPILITCFASDVAELAVSRKRVVILAISTLANWQVESGWIASEAIINRILTSFTLSSAP